MPKSVVDTNVNKKTNILSIISPKTTLKFDCSIARLQKLRMFIWIKTIKGSQNFIKYYLLNAILTTNKQLLAPSVDCYS